MKPSQQRRRVGQAEITLHLRPQRRQGRLEIHSRGNYTSGDSLRQRHPQRNRPRKSDLNEQEALEQLATLCVLARWVEAGEQDTENPSLSPRTHPPRVA